MTDLLVIPPRSAWEGSRSETYRYDEGAACGTYAEYNYLRPGLASRIKLHHFELALRLTSEWFGRAGAIDFGCADGFFLPSLSRHFPSVAGVDRRADFIEISTAVTRKLGLTNVELLCNRDWSWDELRRRVDRERFGVAYVLETLEHAGERGDPWRSRVDLLEEVAGLIRPDGVVVVSVPRMVGFSFLLQRLGLFLLGAHREPISFRNLLRAGLFRDTTELETRWNGGHLGFNHVRLEPEIRARFTIVNRVATLFQVVYVLSRRDGPRDRGFRVTAQSGSSGGSVHSFRSQRSCCCSTSESFPRSRVHFR